ncbi:MAG: xanthine dehydrogenase family protein molybdopterin-binding subunit [Pseudohongiellaceae bacterium]
MNAEAKKYRWIGTRTVRPDGIDKVTGRATFGADFTLPGALCGLVLRSPHAHALILRKDFSKALAIDGVKAVICSDDLREIPPDEAVVGGQPPNFRDMANNLLAKDKVLYEGHAVAAVAAISEEVARRALEAIEIEYQVLPHVIEVQKAMEPDAPLLHDNLRTQGIDPPPETPSNIAQRVQLGVGDVERGFAEADVILQDEFTTQPVHQGYIEPHACIARFGEDGQAQLWCSSQGHFMVRAYCAKLLFMEIAQIRVTPLEIGGGFGGKTTVYLEPLALLMARISGRPVKMTMSREEVFRATGPASGSYINVRIGATSDGRITAAEAILCYQAGAFEGSPVRLGCMTGFAPYDIPNVRMIGYDVVVNRPKSAAYRAPGAPMAAFATESMLDQLALKLEIDPLALRMKNAARKGTKAAYGPRFNDIGYVETLEAAMSHPHYQSKPGLNQGRGVASGFWFNIGGQSSAGIHVTEDGTVIVNTGNPDIGGSRASMAIMAAEVLGIDINRVRPIISDTGSIGYNDLTGGSRVTFAIGMAVTEAARKLVESLKERAALIWDISLDSVIWKDGSAYGEPGGEVEDERKGKRTGKLKAPPMQLSLHDIAKDAARTGGPLSSSVNINAQGAGPGFGTHICDVEVDRDTGKVTILRYTAIQDVGRAIQPDYVEGQLQGGVAQGIGWALNEEYIYNDEGRLDNPGFLDYRIPVASDLPMIDTVLVEVPNPNHPFGVRGVGEVPIIPPLAAVANAIADATGLRMTDLPISPPRLLAALDNQARSKR